MQKKNWLKIIISLTLLIGGVMAFFSLNDTDNNNILDKKIDDEQRRMALYLINNAKDIQKIKFINFVQNTKTGTWSSEVIVNEDIYLTLSVNDFKEDIAILEHIAKSQGKELIFKDTPTHHADINIDVTFYKEN